MNTSIYKLQTKLAAAQTNHVLHLILSIITAGFWVPIWIMVTIWNSIKRGSIEKKMDALAISVERYEQVQKKFYS